MKLVVCSLLILFMGIGVRAHAEHRDTIPLKDKTSPGIDSQMTIPVGKPVKAGTKSEMIPVAKPENIGIDLSDNKPIPKNQKPAIDDGEMKPFVASVETYGSSRINEYALKEALGKDLNDWITKGLNGDPESLELEQKLADRVKQKYSFAAADWSIVQYFEPESLAIHITLDVVEPQDVAKRMPFMSAPNGEYKDPSLLIKQWIEYENVAMDLVEAGELQPEQDECPAFHCPFGHKNPKLKKYEKIFVDGVKKHGKELTEIQAQDRRPEFRAASTYLLAYQKDGKKVVQNMVERIKDPDATVRNNALRVLGDIAEFHPDLIIPIKPVLEAFEFPRVSDRSKAIYVAYLLSANSQQAREVLMKQSVPTLLQIMTSKQPDHRDLAHGILRKISGKEYAATDPQAWLNWYAKLPRERNISKK